MEVLFRCISISLQQPEPGKEIVIHFKIVSHESKPVFLISAAAIQH